MGRHDAVLVVDDDEDTRELMCGVLQKHGFAAEAIESGEACLVRMVSSPVAVVITDLQMPGMSGIELCHAIRGRHPGVSTIVVSGCGDAKAAESARLGGAFSFLKKPITTTRIVEGLTSAFAARPR